MAFANEKTIHDEIGAAQSAALLRADKQVAADGRPVLLIAQRSEALGDAVIRIPAYRAIRAAFPGHRIVSVYLRQSVFSSVFAQLRPQFIDELIEQQDRGSIGHLGSIARGLGNVDVILDFNSSLQALLNYVVSLGKARCYVANVTGLMLRRGVDGLFEPRLPYNSKRYHRLVELAAGRTLPFEPRLPPLPRAVAQVKTLLPSGPRYLGIVPGRPGSPKYWPLERHVALAARLHEMGLRPVYMLGPFADELAQREPLRQASPDAIFIDQETANGDKNYLPWLFHAAAAHLTGCVGTDGGICHLVGTQDIPIATLTGPINGRPWKPVTQQAWIIDARRFGNRAIDTIPVDAVVSVVAEMAAWSDRLSSQGVGRAERLN